MPSYFSSSQTGAPSRAKIASPLGSGLRILPWTIMPMFVAPIAGALSDRIGGARLMGVGLTLQAGGLASLAAISAPTTPYWQLVVPFMVSGIGMAMFWAPVANVVLAAVRPEEEGQASGAQNAIRELCGVFGVAVLASVWSHYGSYSSGASFVDGRELDFDVVGGTACKFVQPRPHQNAGFEVYHLERHLAVALLHACTCVPGIC